VTVIGVVSDTHLPRFGRALPRALERGLRRAGVTRILHLGDFTEPLAAELFEAIAPFDAVCVLRTKSCLNSSTRRLGCVVAQPKRHERPAVRDRGGTSVP